MFNTTLTDPNLAGVIEGARMRAGLSKYRLAVRSGLSLSTIRMACMGVATTRTLARLAPFLGLSIDALRTRRSSPTAAELLR